MTEDEAKTKWCPFIQVSVEKAAGVNMETTEIANRPGALKNTHCIASQCMAWRGVAESEEYATTNNMVADQETMMQRIKTHPSELSLWMRPSGEPLPPPGEGWQPDSELIRPFNALEGVFQRRWVRPIVKHGYCGLAGKP